MNPPPIIWTAPAERSDDGAFACHRDGQRGVALRLPPPSKFTAVLPVGSVLASQRQPSARRISDFTKPARGCSLARRERVRVRETAFVKPQSTVIFPTAS